MTMKNDAKFEEVLTFVSNLISYHEELSSNAWLM